MSRWSNGQKIKVEINGEEELADSIFFDRCPFLVEDEESGEKNCVDDSGGTICRKEHCRLRMMADKYQKPSKKK